MKRVYPRPGSPQPQREMEDDEFDQVDLRLDPAGGALQAAAFRTSPNRWGARDGRPRPPGAPPGCPRRPAPGAGSTREPPVRGRSPTVGTRARSADGRGRRSGVREQGVLAGNGVLVRVPGTLARAARPGPRTGPACPEDQGRRAPGTPPSPNDRLRGSHGGRRRAGGRWPGRPRRPASGGHAEGC